MQSWKVVGGEDTGGILVRLGRELSSALAKSRLSTGSIVREVALIDGRLQYTLISGSGPTTGWVSLKLKFKELLVQVQSSIASDTPRPKPNLSSKCPSNSLKKALTTSRSWEAPPDSISKNLSQRKQIATFAMG